MAKPGPDSTDDELPVVPADDDPDGVFWWRASCLLDAGYSLAGALLIAHTHADLHKAVRMRKAGCDEGTAIDLLI